MMNSIIATRRFVEVPAYAELQQAMHNALLTQHPEWVQRNGSCPECDDYDRRFAQLLSLSLVTEHDRAASV